MGFLKTVVSGLGFRVSLDVLMILPSKDAEPTTSLGFALMGFSGRQPGVQEPTPMECVEQSHALHP